MELDAKAWQAFATTAKLGSISKAARELKCSHSTLSRQIANLEDDLGYLLFERNGNGKKLVLTEEGALLTDKASIAIQTLTELNHQAMHFFDGNTPKAISFAIPDILPNSVEAKLAGAIWKKWPKIELTFRSPSLFESLTLCSQQKVDFAIVCQEQKRLTQLNTEVVGDEELIVLASPSHPLATSEHLTIESLTPYRLFFPISGNTGLSSLEDDLFSIDNSYVQHFAQGLAMATEGLGVTFAPKHLAQPFLDKQQLVSLPIFTSQLSLKMNLELAYTSNYPYKVISDFILKELINIMNNKS